MKKRNLIYSLFLFSSLCSCSSLSLKGKIIFDLQGGTFTDSSFSNVTYLEGDSGSFVKTEIPDPVKANNTFIGWREKDSQNKYRVIDKTLDIEDNKYYYRYPYGDDTFYAYYEKNTSISFDLGLDTASIVAPIKGSEDFQDNTLKGYNSKKIPSTEYLPTATSTETYLHFDYWYTKQSLVVKEDSENNTSGYVIDTTSEEGEYRFDTQMTNGIVYPLENITLYAKWESDPKVTIHFNLDVDSDGTLDTYSFYQDTSKDNIESELEEVLTNKLGFDYTNPGTHDAFYYPSSTKEKRFAGLYLEEEFKTQFSLNSSCNKADFDLYLKWDDKATVTLDYQDGKVNGNSSDTLTDYYVGDVIPESVLTSHTPNKNYSDFSNFVYMVDGAEKEFVFGETTIDSTSLTLTAKYEDYPTLTITLDLPTGYVYSGYIQSTNHIKAGESFESNYETFKGYLTDDKLKLVDQKAKKTSETEWSSLMGYTMPDSDYEIKLVYDYRPVVKFATYLFDGTNYTSYISTSDFETYIDTVVSEDDIEGLKNNLSANSTIYLYDGCYYACDPSTSVLSNNVFFPLSAETSHDARPEITLYRKMTKGVKLTFKTSGTDKILYVLPNSTLSDYQDEISTLLGNYDHLEIGGQTLGNTLPSEDTTIDVIYN